MNQTQRRQLCLAWLTVVSTALTANTPAAIAADYAPYQFRSSRQPASAVSEPLIEQTSGIVPSDELFAPGQFAPGQFAPEQFAPDGGVQHAIDYVDPVLKQERERQAITRTMLQNTTPTLLDDFPSGSQLDEIGDYAVRYTVRHDAGNGIGYQNSFTRFGLFAPLCEERNRYLVFGDLQPFVDNVGNFGLNLGGGTRFYSETVGRVFGAYGYFDYDERNHNAYRGGTVGFDSLGDMLDFRGNYYLPATEYQPVTGYGYGADSLAVGRERALQGGDIEVGVVLPEAFGTQSRIYVGYFQFDTESSTSLEGWRVRVESYWAEDVMTDVQVFEDEDNGTTVVVGVGIFCEPRKQGIAGQTKILPKIYSFRRGDNRHITHSAQDRLAEPVWRLPRIATIKEMF